MTNPLKAFAQRTPLYPLYQSFRDRRAMGRLRENFWRWTGDDEKRTEFYRRFVSSGDVVFDVGANLGNRTKVFLKLGATVVAIEPQRVCADFLESVFARTPDFHLVRKALGASPGSAEILVSTAHTISSLSPDWIRAVKASGRFADYEWYRSETVAMGTLDSLVAQFGRPAFVKIDVEGYEENVLAGLSTPVGALSLEFTPEFMEGTLRCIDRLRDIGEARFQISMGESMEFALPEWVTTEDAKRELSKVPRSEFGDLYARFLTP